MFPLFHPEDNEATTTAPVTIATTTITTATTI
jgi:hypothetical protein